MKISMSKKWITRSLANLCAYTKVTLLLLSVKYTRCASNFDSTIPTSPVTVPVSLENELFYTENFTIFQEPVTNMTERTSTIYTTLFDEYSSTTISHPVKVSEVTEIINVTEENVFPINVTEKIPVFDSPVTINPDCPSLDEADKLSQTQLIERLTHPCRYDRLEHPKRKVLARDYFIITVFII